MSIIIVLHRGTYLKQECNGMDSAVAIDDVIDQHGNDPNLRMKTSFTNVVLTGDQPVLNCCDCQPQGKSCYQISKVRLFKPFSAPYHQSLNNIHQRLTLSAAKKIPNPIITLASFIPLRCSDCHFDTINSRSH